MLTLKPLSIDRSVAGAKIPAVVFIAHTGLTTHELAHMLDSLVRVSRRVERNHLAIMCYTSEFSRAHSIVQGLITMSSEFSPLAQQRWHTRREPSHAVCSNPTYSACAEVARHHINERQSHPASLVPFASLSAISGTFNSLFKVLFIFPSWYLFSIGLELTFSFR